MYKLQRGDLNKLTIRPIVSNIGTVINETVKFFTSVERCQFFNQNKQLLKSLNWQFTVALDGIICFAVRFCDNYLFVLKMRLKVFYFASDKIQRFYSNSKILMSLLPWLIHHRCMRYKN